MGKWIAEWLQHWCLHLLEACNVHSQMDSAVEWVRVRPKWILMLNRSNLLKGGER